LQTILVVDDEPTVLNLCRRILERGGYTVVAATSGLDALRVLENSTQTIDLALLDVIMPGLNGAELAQRIHNLRAELPIVLMSGFGPREIARVVGDIKAFRVIWKPFKTESLIRMIENALGGSAGAITGQS
jgi:two-component system, cell cycle sensor histidine kinase and response regulator CckA